MFLAINGGPEHKLACLARLVVLIVGAKKHTAHRRESDMICWTWAFVVCLQTNLFSLSADRTTQNLGVLFGRGSNVSTPKST